jgi:hypothetical protein
MLRLRGAISRLKADMVMIQIVISHGFFDLMVRYDFDQRLTAVILWAGRGVGLGMHRQVLPFRAEDRRARCLRASRAAMGQNDGESA